MFKRISVLTVCILAICACSGKKSKTDTDETVWPLGFRADTLFVKESKVESGDVFYKLFTRLGMPGGEVQRLAAV